MTATRISSSSAGTGSSASLALTFVLDIVDTLIKGAPYFDTLGIEYLIQVPIGLALAASPSAVPIRRFHLGLVLVHLAYQACWIGCCSTLVLSHSTRAMLPAKVGLKVGKPRIDW